MEFCEGFRGFKSAPLRHRVWLLKAISGEQREMAAFVPRFERPTEPEGRISVSFDAVRVFLSARAQLGSASQLLRLNAARTLAADVADIELT